MSPAAIYGNKMVVISTIRFFRTFGQELMNTIRARDRTPFQEAAEGAVLDGEETGELVVWHRNGEGKLHRAAGQRESKALCR